MATMLVVSAPLFAYPDQAGKTFTLTGVTISGAKRFTQEQLVSASGLKKGQQIDLPGIDAAADRLFKSGALTSLTYTYRMAGPEIEVQFKLAETTQFLPCTFDNFVWFRDEELVGAVRREVPLFDGSLPVGGDLSTQVPDALDHFLHEHSIKGSVIATLSGGLGQQPTKYDLRIADISIPVKAVTVKGGPLNPEALAKPIHLISLSDYSRSVARSAGQFGLTDAYQNEGYLQAKFSDPEVAMKDPQGYDASIGVTLVYEVIPGPQYHLNGVSWSGNQTIPEAELAKLIEVKPGDVARQDKLNLSWVGIGYRYGKEGYLVAQVEPTPEFDVAQSKVQIHVKVVEGAQYRMGVFTATGVPEILANKLKEAWRLRPGQIYDASYENTFFQHDMTDVVRSNATSRFTPILHRHINPETHNVDVELEIKWSAAELLDVALL